MVKEQARAKAVHGSVQSCVNGDRRILDASREHHVVSTTLSSGTGLDEIRETAERLARDIGDGPIVPCVTPEEIRGHLTTRYGFGQPMPLDDIVADVEQMLRTWQVQVTHPRYFGLFNPSVAPASVVADTLVAAYNPQLATWRTSPGPNEIERHTLNWLVGKFGLPACAFANFTNGEAESNLSAVTVALTRSFPDYGENGLRQLAASPTIYLTGEAHHSFEKTAHITGLGRRDLRRVATDDDLKMDVGYLARLVAEDRKNALIHCSLICCPVRASRYALRNRTGPKI